LICFGILDFCFACISVYFFATSLSRDDCYSSECP